MTAKSGLHVENIVKRFGPLTALDNVSASFRPGEIHAVLGENGAGKSTLMGILSGFVVPDSGTVMLNGNPVPVGRPFDCKRLGIEMIHQHFTLVSEFTIAENFALSRLPGLMSSSEVSARAQPSLAAANRLGWELEPGRRVSSLSVGAQQRIEILKALGGDAQVIIFDEPTAVLSPDEVEDLFRVLRQLKTDGHVVILIAHKLSEVLSIADHVTVLRRGRWIASAPIAEVDERKLAEWMVGELPPPLAERKGTELVPGLVGQDLTVLGDRGEAAIKNCSFEIKRGEILGIGGVDGNGQLELAEALVAVRPVDGALSFAGKQVNAEDMRISYVPQDRQHDGLAMGMTIEENLLITGHRKPMLRKGPFLNFRALHQWANQLVKRFSVKANSPADRVAGLSGGNQQKVVVSRALDEQPDLLVVVNPTRGLDIRATEYVHSKIQEARDAGAAVALFSTDLDEIYALADRIMFLSRGELIADTGAESLFGAKA
ncbi:COG3845 ABC-type uncharacterized transport systems, ATPase components [Fimbriimonadaceae bacterium]